MIPVRVYVENFMSYREGQELLFDSVPLWVLAGENGVGKSTIFDAIKFAFYGTHRGERNADIINHKKDNLTVEFDFIVDDIQYRIRRTVSRKSQSTRQAFKVLPDGNSQPISDTNNDTGFKRWVEHTIGLNEIAFTSCIFLVQGQSDKLINAAGKEEAYRILEQLIDLSAYQNLHEEADNLRKDFNNELKGINKQLEHITPVTDEELKSAKEKVTQAETNFKAIQEQVDQLNQILQQSKQWENTQKRIEEQHKKQQEYQQLIQRSDEINTKFNRFQELSQVLPEIKAILEQKQKIKSASERVEKLKQLFKKLQSQFVRAEEDDKTIENELENLNQSIDKFQNDLQELTSQLSKISPLITKLENFEKIQAGLDDCNQKIAELPKNIEEKVNKTDKRVQELSDLKATLPRLQEIVEGRLSLREAWEQKQSATKQLQDLENQVQEYQAKFQKVNAAFQENDKIERNLSQEVAVIKAELKKVEQQLANFDKVSNQPTCELCGQEITPEHIHKEKQRLQENFEQTKFTQEQLSLQHQEAQSNLKRLDKESKVVDGKIEYLKKEINQSKLTQQQAINNIQQSLNQLKKTFKHLPSSYQVKIAPSEPRNEQEWLDTAYPSDTDLEELKQEVAKQEEYAKTLSRLKQQLDTWKDLNSKRQAYDQQLVELQEEFSINEAKNARIQESQLKQTKEALRIDIENLKEQHKQVKSKKDNLNQKLQEFSQQLSECKVELGKNEVIKSETEENLRSQINKLPQTWQEDAHLINNDELQQLEQQRKELSLYENLYEELNQANQSLTQIEQQINSLTQQINDIPQESHHSSKEVEEQIEKARNQRDDVDKKRADAQAQVNKLKDKRQQYLDLENNKKAAEHQQRLYKTLSDLLGKGKNGIQLRILRDAERAIVEITNEILDSLSRGKMRLELRGEGKQSTSTSNKALDLVAYNYATGERPTAVALTSGSQRFRIAVSLALAIGQYAGKGARHIESVIIDEGFGSLDKNGRDDMINELNELQQRLKRIILVSHQEEFFNAFSNGYKVELVEGASKVALLEHSL